LVGAAPLLEGGETVLLKILDMPVSSNRLMAHDQSGLRRSSLYLDNVLHSSKQTCLKQEWCMSILRISPQDAYKSFNSGQRVLFLDVRNPKAWAESDQKLPGATRIPLDDLESRLNGLDRKATIVAYCT
jgi:hypothetical protein